MSKLVPKTEKTIKKTIFAYPLPNSELGLAEFTIWEGVCRYFRGLAFKMIKMPYIPPPK